MAEYNFNFENDDLEKEALEREKLEKERLEQKRLEQERLEQERLELERLEQERLEQEKLEQERLEKQRIEIQKAERKLYPNNSLFMIPSWSDLLGNPTLGTYVHHIVSKIESDPVIFFSSYDYSFETMKGTLHYLFGLGYYSLKFELESGKYITDNRILTGLVLSDFVYDHMATSASVTLEDDPDVIIAEKVVKVPIDLSYKSENHLSFIKGALMRNIFIPNKDIFLEMFEKIRNDDSYQISNYGHKILSSHWDYYNQILVSENMRSKSDSSYLNSTAGLNGINYNSDTLLQNTISADNLSILEYSITNLKAIFSNLDFDPMYLFSILENAAPLLRSGDLPLPSRQRESISNAAKVSIFVSAEDRLVEFKSWPKEFMRKAKIEPEKISKVIDQPLYPEPSYSEPSYPDLGDRQIEDFFAVPKMEELKQEKFELDALKSQKVQAKSLPPPPIADINKILAYLKQVISEDYEMRSIGQAFEIARETVRHIGVSATTVHQAKIWEMSKYANLYIKKESGLGLSIKEKNELIQKVDEWIFEIEENARIERERLEQARLEKERLERERIERERLEKERQEKERLERIRLEKEREERERKEKERQEKERLERIRLEKEREERERLEREHLLQIQKEREEAQRLEEERLRKEREEQEALEREKQELKRLKAERKEKEKAAKLEAKKKKKLEKQRKKIEKRKLKEQEKLKDL